MPHPAKRITRKDLRQPDPFITTTGKVLDLAKEYQRALWIALAAVLAVAVSFGLWSIYQNRQERLAAQEYAVALQQYHGGQLQQALLAFQKVASYRSTAYSRYALLYQANAHLGLGEHDTAVALFEKFLAQERRDPFLRQLALMGLGDVHELRGATKEAAASYSEAYRINGPLKEEALLAQGRVQLQAQDYQSAVATYQELLKVFPNSPRSVEANLRLMEAQSKAPPK